MDFTSTPLTGINDNPISRKLRERYLKQDPKTLEKINQLFNADARDYQLKKIKRSRNKPLEGDIFVLSPRENIYFYGRVLKTNIKHIKGDTFIDGKSVIAIFKSKSKTPDIVNYRADYDDLLTEPAIVDYSYWSQGYFFTIANEVVSEKEKKLDLGFYSIGKGKYYFENGVEIDHEPKLMGTYGITTITGIALMVNEELILNPKLLDF